jgi:transcriptional regulator with XRE-family HTH domain
VVKLPRKALAEARRAAQLLARRIRAAGLSQQEAADRLGVSLSHLNKLLCGRQSLKVERLYAILALLGVEPVEFFTELHGPAASFPAFHITVDDGSGGRPVLNVFFFAEQMLAKADRASRREARGRRRVGEGEAAQAGPGPTLDGAAPRDR